MDRALATLAAVAAVLALVLSGPGERAGARTGALICPSTSPAAGPAFDFDTYEALDYVADYTTAIELAAAGQALTGATIPSGEAHHLEYPGLLTGSREERMGQEPNAAIRIPPSLMKAVIRMESEFNHAGSAVPFGGVGRVLRSFDCGYGLGQITSGMANPTGNPSPGQALTGTHFLFNLAASARILAEKWNAEYLPPIAGGGDPAALEDWYHAIWAYNGFAFVNHPLNHNLPALRGDVWHCLDERAPTWIDAGDGTAQIGRAHV